MSKLTRDKVLAHAHPLDDATIAEIIGTGANEKELVRACAFYAKEKKSHGGADVPVGRVGEVISILERVGASVRGSLLGEAGSTLS
jgi:hypothetical protein